MHVHTCCHPQTSLASNKPNGDPSELICWTEHHYMSLTREPPPLLMAISSLSPTQSLPVKAPPQTLCQSNMRKGVQYNATTKQGSHHTTIKQGTMGGPVYLQLTIYHLCLHSSQGMKLTFLPMGQSSLWIF